MFVWDESSASERLRDASARFERHEAVMLRLRTEGDTAALASATRELQDLERHRRYSKAVLVAVTARLSWPRGPARPQGTGTGLNSGLAACKSRSRADPPAGTGT
jgi:hypothetical protein